MTHITLPGLHEPATIRVDRWGLPHIGAASARDAFFVQGFNAARDRLWQIDLWRKRGLGLLAADFGPGYLMQDRAARLFLYRGDMAPEWAAYGADSQDICTAFAAGINAGIDMVLAGDLPLPPEFAELGTKPAHWAPEDVVRIRTHCLSRNAASELARKIVLGLADPETDLLRAPLSPDVPDDEWAVTHPADLPPDALAVYELATAPVTFSPERLSATLEDAARWSAVDARKAVIARDMPDGSNNWAIAPGKTDTGRAIMASDPHRAHAAPSLRYMVHMTAPGMNLIGAGEPSSPGIMAGHNGTAAFSLTIFCADQEDVMVYDTLPDAPRTYRYRGATEDMTRVDEVFAVKGAADQVLPLYFTRHGPVVWQEQARNLALAVRTVFTDPGSAPYMASLKSMRTTDMASFRDSLTTWGAPTVNMVYADTAGDICWQAAAYVPRRTGWRGLTPVSGDGRFEWAGYMTAADLPCIENPKDGFVYSANEMNLPDTWDHAAQPVGFEWLEDRRAHRIANVLGSDKAQDVAASCALQTDTFSDYASRLVAQIPDDAPAAPRDLLRHWDGFAGPDSTAALLAELWLSSHLRPTLLARVAPDAGLRRMFGPGHIATTVRLLEGAHPGLARRAGLDDETTRAAFLSETLAAAWDDATARFGPDPAHWRWGDLHKGWFDHAATPVTSDFDVGPFDKGGSNTTVMLAAYEASDYRVRHGASVRMVVDVGAWDNSRWINAPGQSGVPGSRHYDDLTQSWARGDYVPMCYSEDAVAEATVETISLRPVPAG
ncbi:penicillin acylase family protein [Lutimaribacter sp. EGI FJ00015]|uniref:Penicillin acylase family protein n=1 Tax=Lutimaribacter degradans TaxID=2945989 RepID=A0ACC5ZTN4_9RHOB|nr:penicillin acylase family protein [Lutimaribacter sp. EGI FJ00013]MCM2561318.1 penicillin acylase family protein [Lutimaribacter sp. EGI FJ00013]MCO0611731.1 penicillin acylase family protein [Lutimaribacter sp. EGI FJ00015]MCO0635147.1 penicillin acylase family protein [Lutimaribacter sp. EGI FJ00014]